MTKKRLKSLISLQSKLDDLSEPIKAGSKLTHAEIVALRPIFDKLSARAGNALFEATTKDWAYSVELLCECGSGQWKEMQKKDLINYLSVGPEKCPACVSKEHKERMMSEAMKQYDESQKKLIDEVDRFWRRYLRPIKENDRWINYDDVSEWERMCMSIWIIDPRALGIILKELSDENFLLTGYFRLVFAKVRTFMNQRCFYCLGVGDLKAHYECERHQIHYRLFDIKPVCKYCIKTLQGSQVSEIR